jgi:serine O-acetyltransferase
VVHQSGVRIDPLAHSALPDAEAKVIRNLMERIDLLESEVNRLQECLREVAAGRPLKAPCSGRAQNIRDREILEFLGERIEQPPASSGTQRQRPEPQNEEEL